MAEGEALAPEGLRSLALEQMEHALLGGEAHAAALVAVWCAVAHVCATMDQLPPLPLFGGV